MNIVASGESAVFRNDSAVVPSGIATPAPQRLPLPERTRRHADCLVVKALLDRVVEGGKAAEMLRAETWALADDLAGPNPTPIERTLAETASVAWLHLRLTEWRHETAEGLTASRSLHLQRRIDHAHRRYLATLRTLATVRKLAVPSLQLNIGTNQVNVGS